jgi:uncharacterized membrane protein YraQ (UPF0718 family)
MDKKKQKNVKAQKSLAKALLGAIKSFNTSLPILIGVILLIGLFKVFISKEFITSLFDGQMVSDTLIGAAVGSIAAGNPITSYIIGGELLEEGVSLFAVTAFIIAWVTVGIVQYPAESGILGKRFAAARNILSFILAVLISILSVITLRVIQ